MKLVTPAVAVLALPSVLVGVAPDALDGFHPIFFLFGVVLLTLAVLVLVAAIVFSDAATRRLATVLAVVLRNRHDAPAVTLLLGESEAKDGHGINTLGGSERCHCSTTSDRG